jgi:CheY-like chemotaxis protein
VEYAHDTHPNMSCVMISATASDVRNDPIGHHIKTVVPKPMSRRGILNSLINMHSNQPMSTQAAEPIFTTVSKRQEQRTLRILTTEDNKTNQLVFSKMVKSLEIELRFANNGEDAIKEYETFQPDLIFMDISMPKMDGKDACRAIRNQERTKGLPPVPIIALTAHAINGDKDEILSVGMDRYLTKPLKKDEILTAIADFTPKNVKSAQA